MDTRTGKRRPGQDVRPENVWSRSIFRAAGNILKFLAATRAARTRQDIDAAAQLFARACAQLSIATLITILTRGAAKIAARPGFRQRQKSGGGEKQTTKQERRIDEPSLKTPERRLDRSVDFASKQLQKKFSKHAEDFGITGSYNKTNADKFQFAVKRHIMSPQVQPIQGTYRGAPVVHYVNPNTGLNAMTGADGKFISGWKLNQAQLRNVLARGSL